LIDDDLNGLIFLLLLIGSPFIAVFLAGVVRGEIIALVPTVLLTSGMFVASVAKLVVVVWRSAE
jgi:hypothetical protein